MRAFGKYAMPVMVTYGLALAAIEAHCTGWCIGCSDYDSKEGNIVKDIKRRLFGD